MKISIDTKEDSHEEIKKVIRMLHHLVGESKEVFTNQPDNPEQTAADTQSAFTNIFGDSSSQNSETTSETAPEASTETQPEKTESSEELFTELFSKEEIDKMDQAQPKDKDEDPKDDGADVQVY